MSPFKRAVAQSVLLHLVSLAFFTIDYALMRYALGANPAWAAGAAAMWAVLSMLNVRRS